MQCTVTDYQSIMSLRKWLVPVKPDELSIEISRTDSIPLLKIGNEFIQCNGNRVHIFGQYNWPHSVGQKAFPTKQVFCP